MIKSIISLIFCLLLAVSCQKEELPYTSEISLEGKPKQQVWSSEISVFNDGKLSSKILAGEIQKFEVEKQIIATKKIRVNIFENGKVSSTVDADSGIVFEKTNDVDAFGNVVVHSDSGITIFTEEMHWLQKNRIFKTEVNVIVVTEKDTLYGTGLESDEKLENWHILNPFGKSERKIERSNQK